jgi:hypothetical protein
LLPITRKEINNVLNRIAKALKENGVLYASLKYGNKEYEKEGRYFNCYDEDSIDELINKNNYRSLLKCWTANDNRPGREDEIWLNCPVIKDY